ncbi:MAG: non-canonical purine NTP pyrophosphatase [Solirubrobacteraceae bacterium]
MASGPLVLSTRNAHKVREINRLLAGAGIEVVPLPARIDLPPEDGESFAENALDKARAAAAATGLTAIADDSGIEALAIGGAPGVRSARYAGPGASDEQNLEKLIREAPAGSELRYVCALAYVEPGDRAEDGGSAGLVRATEHVFFGECRGRLAPRRAGTGGFGYDPMFLVDGDKSDRTMAELSDAEKDAISHRGHAVRALMRWLGSRR